MGLKDRAKRVVSAQLRPWLLHDVVPAINVGVSEVSVVLSHLEFDAVALNRAGMESSPLLIKSMQLESLQLTFAPFRQSVLAVLMQGWSVDLEPRSANDVWWEKKEEKVAEQKRNAALEALDPQGAGVHTAAEGLAEEKAGSSLITQFLTSLMLMSVRVEFRDCCLRLVSHVDCGSKHVCSIPLSSFEFGGCDDGEGFSWSGGLMGVVTAAFGGIWTKNGAPVTKYCVVRGFGLLIKTHGVDGHGHETSTEDNEEGSVNGDVDGTTASGTPVVAAKRVDDHVVLFEEWVLGVRFTELAMDALEFDVPQLAVGLELQEMHALQILSSQIQGIGQDSPTRTDTRPLKVHRVSELEDGVLARRSASSLWKKGIQKAMELSSHGRLSRTFEAGILRSRYSSLYESWLRELGWRQRQSDGAERNKRRADHIAKLSEEIAEIQKKLPIEAIALGRRLARHRVSAVRDSTENTIRNANSALQARRLRQVYSSFQTFMASLWRVIVMSTILMQGKAIGVSMWVSAARRLGLNEWKSISGLVRGSGSNKNLVANDDDSWSASGSDSTPITSKRTCAPESYFQLDCLEEDCESEPLPTKKQRRWGMSYSLKIRSGSIILAGRPIKALRKAKEASPGLKEGGSKLESALTPAVCLSWKEMVLAYGSSGNTSGVSMSCGNLEAELFSLIPSQLSQKLCASLDAKVFHKEFSSLGRWTFKKAERSLLLSSSPCPQRKDSSSQTISGHPLAGEIYNKHWTWQEQHLESWSISWTKPRVSQQMNGSQSTTSLSVDYDRPFFIAELNNLEDEPTTDAYPGGLTKFFLAVGQLDLSLKGSSFTCLCHLLDQLKMSQTPEEKTYRDTRTSEPQNRSQPTVPLQKFWDDSHSQYLNLCRDTMVAAIPTKSILFTAVVECPRFRLSATAAELHEHDTISHASSGMSRLDSSTQATVVVDIGRFELAMWPPQKEREAVVETPLQEVESKSTAPKDLRNHAVESKLWLQKPPASARQDFSKRNRLEHEQVGSNFYICIDRMAVTLELNEKILKELPVFGPLALVVETSLCWDHYSSLSSTSKSVSASISGKISPLFLQLYMAEVNVVQQVIGFYAEVMKSRLDHDPIVVVDNGHTFLIVSQEEPALLSEDGEDGDSIPDSLSAMEDSITACTLTFSLQLESFRLVLGDSRQEETASSKSVSGIQAKARQNGRSYEEPKGEVSQALTNDNTWEQDPSNFVLGREVYVLIQNVSLGASVGDEENLCVFMRMNDTLVRLVDSGSRSSRSDLAKMKIDFFSASMQSLSGLVLADVALECLSVKAFGASAHQRAIDDKVSKRDGPLDELDLAGIIPTLQQDNGAAVDAPELSPHQTEIDLVDLVRNSFADPANVTVKLTEGTAEQLITEDQAGPKQQKIIQNEESSSSNPMNGETFWLAADVEVSKVLVIDGSIDVLLAKTVLVASGAENLHLHFGVDRSFQKISAGVQGGLVLVHTTAVATLLHFYQDFVARPASLVSDTPESSPKNYPVNSVQEDSNQGRSKASVYRSASAPVFSTQKGTKDMKRTSSAPSIAEIMVADKSEPTLPVFEGVIFSNVAGFSLLLAKQSGNDSEGVLFELEMATMLELGQSAKKSTFDLLRFTILGLPARAPGNSRKAPSRTGSRIPQFSSFKLPYGTDVQSLLDQRNKPLSTLEEASESKDDEREKDQPKKESNDQSSPDALSSAKEERLVTAGKDGLKGNDGPQHAASVSEQAEGFHKSLSDFNSFILQRLSVRLAVEKVCYQDRVWKWANAWNGQCSIGGCNVAITTSEIQLLESLVAPLSSIGGSSNESTGGDGVASDPGVDVTEEGTDETDFQIPDGAIIAIKDVYEHCYLAAEDISNSKGQYRLTGVLHYTLAEDRALFKVKYQDSYAKNSNKDSWFSLLSLHAKDPDGEPFRVRCRPGSGLADISSSKAGSWEKWRFVPAELSDDENSTEVDIQTPTNKRLFHLVNQKNKSGIAFQENAPVIVKQPGNPFKVKIFAKPQDQSHESRDDLAQTGEAFPPPSSLVDQEVVDLVNSIPRITCTFDTCIFTVLHEAGSGLHLLPLLRVCIPGGVGVLQTGLAKTRTILQCGIVLEHFESQTSRWVSIVNPIETDVFYRTRSPRYELAPALNGKKCPATFFSRFRKVDVVFSEPSLDACLFLIGTLDLAGPYSLRYSPVQANRCVVKNHTGVNALCQFDQGSSTDVGGMIPSWHTDSFLMRHVTSRRDTGPAKVASSVALCLQKSGKGATSPVVVSLGDPGVFAIKTRLQTDSGKKTTGPMVVVDVSRRSEDGIKVTVSPMVRIRNASGLPLEFKCRRDASVGEEGAVVELDDGDTIDDSMAAFDALNLTGELRKALKSLNLGNYFLSVRPANAAAEAPDSEKGETDAHFDWSEDIKGAKPVQSSGLLDKLQYSFNNTVRAHNLKTAFGMVFCASKLNVSKKKSSGPYHNAGLHFLVRTTCRQVPISRPKTEAEKDQQHGGQYSVIAWQQQQELLLLPTVRVMNLTTSNIKVLLVSTSDGKRTRNSHQGNALQKDVSISSFGTESMYVDLGDLLLTVKQENFNLTSKPISIGVGIKEFSKNSKADRARDIEMEVDFGDGIHYALVNVRRGVDGVLEIVLLTRYTLQNDSHVNLQCCSARQQSSWWGGLRPSKHQEPDWPISGNVLTLAPKSRVSWFESSTSVLFKRTEPLAEPALLDLESVSGSMEISLRVHCPDSVDSRIQLGVQLNVPSAGDSNPSCIIRLVPRYVVANDSSETILVCQDGFQDTSAMVSLAPGESSALNAQELTDQLDKKGSGTEEAGPDVLLKVRFRPKESGWNWSGPVFAAAIGSFSVKIRRLQQEELNGVSSQKPQTEDLWFAVLNVEEKESSLVMSFRRQPGDSIPYRIENALRSAAITYNQQGLESSEVLEAGASVGYVWDDLGEAHSLVVNLAGTNLHDQINPDKLRSWKSFRASRGNKMGLLQIPFLNDLSRLAMYADASADDAGLPTSQSGSLPLIGYEVYADGPTRVVRLCEERDGRVERHWQSDISSPNMEIEMRIPIFTVSIVEPEKQSAVADKEESTPMETVTYVPVICLRLTNVLVQARITAEYTFCQVKAERLDVDVKWKGAPVAAMLRGHGQDRFDTGHTVLHMAIVMSNLASNPIQLKYASVLLQAVDLNLDEDTLMKLVPFYRLSLSESTAPSRQIYFERFEIHPIKMVGSFLPGKPRADYSSGQETLRALLHSVIKVPTVRGATVELNGVLLSNALLTFKQLALKCAQHYSWYSMRAVYIARGSKLLPPGFASLFDDSAASSLDVFFDPASGSIDLQGLTLGMFGMLKRGLRKKGKGGGTQRYLGDLQHTVKAAGSNILFAAVTEVSDSVLKGADANGFDGVVGGFRRGILNVAMKPSVLRGAVVQGGSTRRIKLDRIVGANEAYIEGYLQAMLDALFKQSYVRVKVMDDLVLLKNLPPNTTLMEEMVQCVRDFLIGEGLLAGESSAAALSSLRRLQGEDERRLGPTVVALCEQLLVIIVVRSLRRQTIKVLRQHHITVIGSDQPEIQDSSKHARKENSEEEHQEHPRQGFFEGINFKRAVTGFALSSVLAYADGRICRHIPNPLVRRVVSGFLLSFVE